MGAFPILLACLLAVTCWVPGGSAAQVPIMVRDNLFSPERKPVATPQEAPSDPRKAKSMAKAFQLDGIFYFGEQKSALLRVNMPGAKKTKDKNASPYVRVREKDTVGDYQVVRIERDAVTLKGNGETLMIPLLQEGKVSPPAAQLPPPPTPEPPGKPAEARGLGEKQGSGQPEGKPGTQGGPQPPPQEPAPAQAAAATPAAPNPSEPAAEPQSWRARGVRAMRPSGDSEGEGDNNATINELRQAIETLQQSSNP